MWRLPLVPRGLLDLHGHFWEAAPEEPRPSKTCADLNGVGKDNVSTYLVQIINELHYASF